MEKTRKERRLEIIKIKKSIGKHAHNDNFAFIKFRYSSGLCIKL